MGRALSNNGHAAPFSCSRRLGHLRTVQRQQLDQSIPGPHSGQNRYQGQPHPSALQRRYRSLGFRHGSDYGGCYATVPASQNVTPVRELPRLRLHCVDDRTGTKPHYKLCRLRIWRPRHDLLVQTCL
jgi:hypothetical protein